MVPHFAGALVAVLLGVLCSVAWTIAGKPARTTADLVSQAQLLLAAAGQVLTAVLVGTTIYYAVQTKNLVLESRAARQSDGLARAAAHRESEARRIEGAAAALVGASSDLIAAGTMLATLVQRRRVWRLRAVEPGMQSLVSASRALDELRYLAPGPITEAGGRLLDAMLAYFRQAAAGASPQGLEAVAGQLYGEKQRLNQEVTQVVRSLEAAPITQAEQEDE